MKTSTAGIRPATISRMPTASATDQYGSGCRNRQPVSHHGTRTAPTPPVTTNQAALVITAADLRITFHPLGPPGRYRHRVASRRGGRSRYAFQGSPTMAWIGGHGPQPNYRTCRRQARTARPGLPGLGPLARRRVDVAGDGPADPRDDIPEEYEKVRLGAVRAPDRDREQEHDGPNDGQARAVQPVVPSPEHGPNATRPADRGDSHALS